MLRTTMHGAELITLILTLAGLTVMLSSQNGEHAVIVASNSVIVDHSESSCQEARFRIPDRGSCFGTVQKTSSQT